MEAVAGYTVVRRLGETMAGERLLVRAPGGDKFLELMRYFPYATSREEFPRVREAIARLRAVGDPRLGRIVDVVEEKDDTLCVIYEHASGGSLEAMQRKLAPKRLPVAAALAIVRDAGRALASGSRETRGGAHAFLTSIDVCVDFEGRVRVDGFLVAAAEAPLESQTT